MPQLQYFEDPSGQMSQSDITKQNLLQIINEFNRQDTTLANKTPLDLYSDGSSNRYAVGYLQNGWGAGKNVGIKVSQPGVEVTGAADSQLLYKYDLSTMFFYDASTGKNVMQIGLLPDGTYGWAVAAKGYNVADGYA